MSKALEVDIVIYHGECPDGKAGAWPFWREKKSIEFYGLLHGHKPPEVEDKVVVFVDFCFPYGIIEKLAQKAKKIIILDHHESAKTDLERPLPSNVETIFDIQRSGAQIAWDYIYPEQRRPWFIEIIADRDLWVWKIPNSKEIGKALFVKGYYTWEKMEELLHLETISNWIYSFTTPLSEFIDEMYTIGSAYIEREEREISAICSRSILAEFTIPKTSKSEVSEKYLVRMVDCPSNYRSEVGNRLCENFDIDFAVMWRYDFLLDEWWITCRGKESKGINLAVLCKQFHRGGGQRNAAGFTIFGSNRLLAKKDLADTGEDASEEAIVVKGEKLQTYFRPLEAPKNRPQNTL